MELKDLRNLAGLNECGIAPMSSMSSGPRVPATLSVTAASGPELSGMLKDIMSLAGLHKVEPKHLGAEPEPMKLLPEPVKAVGPAASDVEVMRGITDKLNLEKDVKADEAWDNTPASAEPEEPFDSNEFAHHPNPPGAGKGRGLANNPRGTVETVESRLWEDYNKFVEQNLDEGREGTFKVYNPVLRDAEKRGEEVGEDVPEEIEVRAKYQINPGEEPSWDSPGEQESVDVWDIVNVETGEKIKDREVEDDIERQVLDGKGDDYDGPDDYDSSDDYDWRSEPQESQENEARRRGNPSDREPPRVRGSQHNFTSDDLQSLSQITDLDTLKAKALELISTPSARPMRPEKLSWFKNALERMDSAKDVIKLMYDLFLSGEKLGVIGSRRSQAYHDRFREDSVDMQESAISAATAKLQKAISSSLDKKNVSHSWKSNSVVAVADDKKNEIQDWLNGLVNKYGVYIEVIGHNDPFDDGGDNAIDSDDDEFDRDSSFAEPSSKSYSDDDESDDWGSDRM